MFQTKKHTIFTILAGIFITNAVVAELIGPKLINVGFTSGDFSIGPYLMSVGILPWPVAAPRCWIISATALVDQS